MKSWSTIKVGDSIFNDGSECKVLEVGMSGKTFLLSFWYDANNWETQASRWYTQEEAIRLGWILGEEKKDKVEEFKEFVLSGFSSVEPHAKFIIIDKVKELFDN
jgi:hypothetical protein